MRRLLCTLVVAVPLLALSVEQSGAHHSFSAVYDEKQDKSGKVETWTVEFAGRLNLMEGGWTVETVKPGDRIKVTGNPARKSDRQIAFRRIVKADGTELLPTQARQVNAIEQERRERARQRNQGK